MNRTLIILLALVIISCKKIGIAPEVSFIETNALIIDSINQQRTHNDQLIRNLNPRSLEGLNVNNIARIRDIINHLNDSIIDVKDLIISESKNTTDKVATQRILLQLKRADQLLDIANESRTEIEMISKLNNNLIEEINNLSPNTNFVPSDEDWATYTFEEMPLYSTVSIMNRWILENEKWLGHVLQKL